VLYHLFELGQAAVRPARYTADAYRLFFDHPFNPFAHTAVGRGAVAACEVFERTTRRYTKPSFGLSATPSRAGVVDVRERVVWQSPFCRVIHFSRDLPPDRVADPKVLLVAPMSGHHATLLRGTVASLLPEHEVFITDWTDARMVPVSAGRFDLDSYIDHMVAIFRLFGGDVHVMAVCQPSVPVLAAVAHLESLGDPSAPASMILMGGPIDTRINPTAVNRMAAEKPISWFERNVITEVPWPNPGRGRDVYPGFLQLTGFMQMNLDRHINAHKDLFLHLVRGDGDSAQKHREFYDEYLAVMDLSAEFYLQTVESVFIRHDLARGAMTYRNAPVQPQVIKRTALMTIEGENDDITGLGQCKAAQHLCSALGDQQRLHFVLPHVGHYGIFNGSRFRADLLPRITGFVSQHDAPFGRRAKAVSVETSQSRAPGSNIDEMPVAG
jgi:poly(3-hydroxybutyrate) depolymerase